MNDASTAGYFNIGEAARRSDASTKMARHYESLGLLRNISRTDSGYRQFTDKDVHTLRFIRRSRNLAFSMIEISELLKLWQNQQRSSQDVRNIAVKHAEELDQRIHEMQAIKRTLEHLISCCSGNDWPDCPILDELGNARNRTPSP